MLAVPAVAARRDGNHPALVALRRRRAHDVDAATAGGPHCGCRRGTSPERRTTTLSSALRADDVLAVVASGGDCGGGQDGDDGGSNVRPF